MSFFPPQFIKDNIAGCIHLCYYKRKPEAQGLFFKKEVH